jgi:hypothetical protein
LSGLLITEWHIFSALLHFSSKILICDNPKISIDMNTAAFHCYHQLNTISNIVDLVSKSYHCSCKELRSSPVRSIPESGGEVGRISELLGGLLIDASQVGTYLINVEATNEEALHIIDKALFFAEQKLKKNFRFYQILSLYATRQIIYVATITNVQKTNNSRF